jgi:hypothetical protein
MSVSRACALTLLVFGASLLGSAPLLADEPTLAEKSFAQGRQAMATEDYALARMHFEASYRADPALGALLNLAVCEEKVELWNAALTHLEEALVRVAADDRRRPSIAARLEELRARIPHLTLLSKIPLASDVTLWLDQSSIDPANIGTPLPLDPGSHTIQCKGARGVLCLHEFAVRERESVEWSVAIDSAQVATQEPPAPKKNPQAAAAAPHYRSALALWAGGAGLASLALGLAAGAEVIHLKSSTAQHCDGAGCDPAGMAAAASGRTWSLVSTIATAVGFAGLGTWLYLSVTAPSSQSPSAEVAVRGRF